LRPGDWSHPGYPHGERIDRKNDERGGNRPWPAEWLFSDLKRFEQNPLNMKNSENRGRRKICFSGKTQTDVGSFLMQGKW